MNTANLFAALFTFFAALAWLRAINFFAQKGWLDKNTSRKIIHIGTGPIFVLCWLLFDDSEAAKYLAALVPLLITAQFILVGTGLITDKAAVQAMSRTGHPSDILRGPLLYGVVFVVITILYWRYSPLGIAALMLLCGGDGFAELVGKKVGKRKLPWSRDKTWWGSTGMFVGGWIFAAAILFVYSFGVAQWMAPGALLSLVTIMAAAGTLVETLRYKDIDNLTITLSSLLAGHIFLQAL